jgi:hypothetical protein
MILNKKEIKIFLTFFIIYIIFIHWEGWNGESSFSIVRAIVDENKLNIDNYFNYNLDRSYYNEHYYSNKAPGLAFLAIPTYNTWKFLYNLFSLNRFDSISYNQKFYYRDINNEKVVLYVENVDNLYLVSQVLITIFVNSMYSSLLILLIYKFSRIFLRNEGERLVVIIALALGTLILPYSVVFFTHVPSAFLIFFSFYFLFDSVRRKADNKRLLLAGVLAGFSVVVDNLSIFILAGLVFYLFLFKRKNFLVLFLIGIFLGILPQLLYNFIIFRNPLEFTYKYMDPAIWSSTDFIKETNTLGFKLSFNPYLLLKLLIDPYRGFFFYSPVLLISLIGFWLMRIGYKRELFFILFTFSLLLYVNSIFWGWWGGSGQFGPRYLTMITPFFCLPLIFAVKNINFKIIKILVIVSILVNLSSLQRWGVLNENLNTLDLDDVAKEKVASIQIISNPITQYYLPLFIDNGPRSRIFENILEGKIDIRDKFPPAMQDDPKFPFVAIFPLSLFLFMIWRKDISINKFIRFLSKNGIVFIIVISIIFLFLLFHYYNFNSNCCFLFFGDGWYKEQIGFNSPTRSMAQNATLYLVNPNFNSRVIKFYYDIWSYNQSRNLYMFLGNTTNSIIIPNYQITLSSKVRLNVGVNIIKFYSSNNCSVLQGTNQCISFTMSNFIFE